MNIDVTYSICDKCSGLNRVPFNLPDKKSPLCGKCKILLPLHHGINELTVSTLETLSNKSPLPVVVDFWAPWCGPCRSFAPKFIEAASQLKNRIVFGKINTETHPSAGQKFGIKGIPTFILFYHGKEVSRVSGALPLNEFVNWVNQTASN
ncbi:MAG: thioredoxin TrxC [Bdellovibrio sp.]|nr:thioredoxin TrxC [Bdellovibrio sp.]